MCLRSVVADISRNSTAKSLHGIFALGHGSRSAIGSSGPEWKLRYADVASVLRYKGALVIINACASSAGASSLCTGTANSICRGHTGIHDPSDGLGQLILGLPTGTPYIHSWDAISPGDQETDPDAQAPDEDGWGDGLIELPGGPFPGQWGF